MKRVLHLVYLFLCLSGCLSLPSPPNAPFVAYPINSQRPPVARVGQLFSWSFLPGTFNTSNGTAGMSFQTENLPSWASFAPETRTISGTPDSSSLGTTIVRITAYNTAKSSSVTDNFRLLVATGQPPTVKLPLGSQLGNGSVLGSAKYDHSTQGISVPPNWSWSIGLLPDTYVMNNGAGIYYTAYEVGTTSLPSWMKFNTVTATFDGVSPNEQQDIWIVVYGSDHFGYGDVQQTFRFTVSQHTLDLVVPLPAINATAESIVNYTIPLDCLTIDGVPKNSSTAIQVNVDLSEVPYLTFDEENLSISGSLPQSLAAFTNVSIPIGLSTPSCHNNISTQVFLRVVPGLFTAPVLPPVYVHPDENFSFDLRQFTSNLNATYSLGSIAPQAAQQWIHFSAEPLTLSGQAPSEYALAGQNITIDLEASGLNGLKSSALLPVFFVRTQTKQIGRFSRSRGLSNLAKTMLAIVLGTVGSLLLLVFMMRTCRTYCSEDGQREKHEEDAIYQSYFTYTGEKSEEPKAMDSPIKGTPLSAGDTLIDSRSPRWDEKAGVGGPMMAITQNELALVGEPQSPHSGLKRLDIFNVFAKPSRVDVARSSTHPSLQGLGIAAPGHRVVNVTTDSQPNINERDYESEESGSDASAGNRANSSEGQRTSWNTTTSSSIFYSDTQGEESEVGSSSRSRNESQYLATPSGSIPRRRKDFRTGHSLKDEGLSTSSSGSSNDVDIGTIRMVSKAETGTSLDVTSNDDEAIACSESLGVINTASYHKINPESFGSGAPSSEAGSGSSLRPTLIPFQSKQGPKMKSVPSSSPAHDPSPESVEDDRASLNPFDSRPRGGPQVEHDIGTSQRLSAQSVPYDFQASGSRSGSPTTSAIFFSPPRELNSQVTRAKPSPPSGNHPETTKIPTHPGSPDIHDNSTAEKEYPSKQSRSETFGSLVGPVIVTVGVGEPFHVTPSMKPGSRCDVKQSQSTKSPALQPGSRFYALTDYPDEPSKDRKQLPEWLHFDAREYEIWGIPRKIDVGLIAVQIIERKSAAAFPKATPDHYGSAASPSLGRLEEVEEVVARFILDVVDKSSLKGPGHGDVSIVTF